MQWFKIYVTEKYKTMSNRLEMHISK